MRRSDYEGPRDLRAMQDAVRRTWTPRSRWHVGDLAWRRYAVPDREPHRRTALWRDGDGGPVLAWGWAELPGDLSLYVDPNRPGLADEVVAWFEGVATGPDRAATVLATEGHLRGALERAGYRVDPGAPFFLHCLLALDGRLPAPRLPEGYRVRAVRDGEEEARAAVHRAAWRPARIGALLVPPVDLGDDEPPETASSFRALRGAWPYRLGLDQVVEAPDGTLVASALGWLDEANRAGELEPVGTDPRHAHRGLGAAVTLACLRALRDAGATRAVVYPRGDDAYPVPRGLYLGLGFRPVARTVTYIR